MNCIFATNGIGIKYDGILRPCCQYQGNTEHINNVLDVDAWRSKHILPVVEQPGWPTECTRCEQFEAQGRNDSMRLNGERAYSHYTNDDLTLEIRPGNTCNFACQTCWPQASS